MIESPIKAKRHLSSSGESSFSKLERDFKNIESVKLTFKEHKDQGKPRYEAHFMITGPSSPVVVNHIPQSLEWDPVAITRSVLLKAQKELKKKF